MTWSGARERNQSREEVESCLFSRVRRTRVLAGRLLRRLGGYADWGATQARGLRRLGGYTGATQARGLRRLGGYTGATQARGLRRLGGYAG